MPRKTSRRKRRKKRPSRSRRKFSSSAKRRTFDNSVYGIFALGDFALASWNALKVSVNYENDTARTQDDVNYPWMKYTQGTFSAAIENHISLSDQWKLIGGLSLDYLDKISGENRTKLNPLIGIKFTPREDLDLHLSMSQKSKFPSMRSMYSSSSGNPDLLSETGTNAEIGFTFNKGIYLSGAAFISRFENRYFPGGCDFSSSGRK